MRLNKACSCNPDIGVDTKNLKKIGKTFDDGVKRLWVNCKLCGSTMVLSCKKITLKMLEEILYDNFSHYQKIRHSQLDEQMSKGYRMRELIHNRRSGKI